MEQLFRFVDIYEWPLLGFLFSMISIIFWWKLSRSSLKMLCLTDSVFIGWGIAFASLMLICFGLYVKFLLMVTDDTMVRYTMTKILLLDYIQYAFWFPVIFHWMISRLCCKK